MLYFSPLSVTDDKQRDRNHPCSSFYSAGRAIWGWVGDVVTWGSKIYTLGDPRCIRYLEAFLAPPYPELMRILRCLPCRMCTLYVGGAGAIVCCMQWWCCVFGYWDSGFMIRPQVPEYSRPFQLSLLRIVGGKPMCGVIIEDEISFSFWFQNSVYVFLFEKNHRILSILRRGEY